MCIFQNKNVQFMVLLHNRFLVKLDNLNKLLSFIIRMNAGI